MKKYAILTFTSNGMARGSAPNESSTARLNEGELNSLQRYSNGAAKDLIIGDDGKFKKFNSQVHALNYCIEQGWNLEQTIFESGYGFNDRDPLSSFIFILYKEI